MSKKPTIVSKKRVLTYKYFHVEEIQVKYPKINTRTYGQVTRNSSIYILPLTKEYELYMISQYRFMYEKKRLELIAGFVDDGEKPFDAAKRELMEEAGIKAKKWILLAITELSGSVVKSEVYFYLAQDLTMAKATPEADEDIALLKLSLNDLVSKVMDNTISDLGSKLGILMVNQLQLQKKI